MTLVTLRSRVSANINNSKATDTLIDQWINNIQRYICQSGDFYFMETEVTTSTVASQASYDLPDGSDALRFKNEISCELIDNSTDRRPIQRLHRRDAEERFTDYDETGTPVAYAIQGKALWLYPTPDDNEGNNWTINLEYYGYLADLSTDAGTNDLISDHTLLVEYGATALGFRYLMDDARATYYEGVFDRLLSELKKEQAGRTFGSIEQGLKPRAGSGTSLEVTRFDLDTDYSGI